MKGKKMLSGGGMYFEASLQIILSWAFAVTFRAGVSALAGARHCPRLGILRSCVPGSSSVDSTSGSFPLPAKACGARVAAGEVTIFRVTA